MFAFESCFAILFVAIVSIGNLTTAQLVGPNAFKDCHALSTLAGIGTLDNDLYLITADFEQVLQLKTEVFDSQQPNLSVAKSMSLRDKWPNLYSNVEFAKLLSNQYLIKNAITLNYTGNMQKKPSNIWMFVTSYGEETASALAFLINPKRSSDSSKLWQMTLKVNANESLKKQLGGVWASSDNAKEVYILSNMKQSGLQVIKLKLNDDNSELGPVAWHRLCMSKNNSTIGAIPSDGNCSAHNYALFQFKVLKAFVYSETLYMFGPSSMYRIQLRLSRGGDHSFSEVSYKSFLGCSLATKGTVKTTTKHATNATTKVTTKATSKATSKAPTKPSTNSTAKVPTAASSNATSKAPTRPSTNSTTEATAKVTTKLATTSLVHSSTSASTRNTTANKTLASTSKNLSPGDWINWIIATITAFCGLVAGTAYYMRSRTNAEPEIGPAGPAELIMPLLQRASTIKSIALPTMVVKEKASGRKPLIGSEATAMDPAKKSTIAPERSLTTNRPQQSEDTQVDDKNCVKDRDMLTEVRSENPNLPLTSAREPSETGPGSAGPSELSMREQSAMGPSPSAPGRVPSAREPSETGPGSAGPSELSPEPATRTVSVEDDNEHERLMKTNRPQQSEDTEVDDKNRVKDNQTKPSETGPGLAGTSELSMREQSTMGPSPSAPGREPGAGEPSETGKGSILPEDTYPPESDTEVSMPKVDKQEPPKCEILPVNQEEGVATRTVSVEDDNEHERLMKTNRPQQSEDTEVDDKNRVKDRDMLTGVMDVGAYNPAFSSGYTNMAPVAPSPPPIPATGAKLKDFLPYIDQNKNMPGAAGGPAIPVASYMTSTATSGPIGPLSQNYPPASMTPQSQFAPSAPIPSSTPVPMAPSPYTSPSRSPSPSAPGRECAREPFETGLGPAGLSELSMREQSAMGPSPSAPGKEPGTRKPSETDPGLAEPPELSMREQSAMGPSHSAPGKEPATREPSETGKGSILRDTYPPGSNTEVSMPKVDKQELSKCEILLVNQEEGVAARTMSAEPAKSSTMMPTQSSMTRQVSMPLPQRTSTDTIKSLPTMVVKEKASGRKPLIGSEATAMDSTKKSIIAPIKEDNERERLLTNDDDDDDTVYFSKPTNKAYFLKFCKGNHNNNNN